MPREELIEMLREAMADYAAFVFEREVGGVTIEQAYERPR